MKVRDIGRRACNGGRGEGAQVVAILVLVVALAACGSNRAQVRATSSQSARTPAPRPAPTPAPSPSPTRTDPLSTCGPSVAFASLPVLTRLAAADDVAVAADGTVWVDDAARTLIHVSSSGAVLQRISDPRAPEGMVVLPDGSLLLAEQGPDRVVRMQPGTQALSVVLQLTPRSGQLGVDGIAFDTAANAVVVPDSPNGTLLEASVGGGPVTRLATGLGRPVGVALVQDGSFVVVAENSTGVYRVPARGGTAAPSPAVTQADDVVVSGQVAYVTSLTAHELIAMDLVTLRTRVLVTGDAQAQGLAQMPDGLLVLTDSATGVVATLHGC